MNDIIDEIWSQAEILAGQGYSYRVSEDELTNAEKVYILEHPALPGCMADGTTFEEALAELNQVRVEYIYFMLLDGLEVPPPNLINVETGISTTENKLSIEMDESQGFRFLPRNPEPQDGRIELNHDGENFVLTH